MDSFIPVCLQNKGIIISGGYVNISKMKLRFEVKMQIIHHSHLTISDEICPLKKNNALQKIRISNLKNIFKLHIAFFSPLCH